MEGRVLRMIFPTKLMNTKIEGTGNNFALKSIPCGVCTHFAESSAAF